MATEVVDVSPRPTMSDAYLGDGLYASFDGYQTRLYTQREFGVHEIFVEPPVYEALVDYWQRCHKA